MPPKAKKLIRKKKRRPADRDSSGVEDEEKVPELPVQASPKTSSKANPKASPRASPKASPKASPQASPKTSPKSEPSKDREEDAEYKALSKEAVKLIEDEISKPDAQKDGKAFIPREWATKFKAKLGPYRKFVHKNSVKFTTYTTENSNFVIMKAGAPAPDGVVPSVPWKNVLYKAWIEYCKVVPKEERDFNTFCAAIPGKPASLKSPKVSPKSAPLPSKSAPQKSIKKVKKVVKKKKT